MSATTTETLEARRERASLLLARLRQEYPDAQCSLNFSNPLELLVATILSAQCTDERVNQVTESLFQKYRAAEDYARAPLEALEQDIRQTGFYRRRCSSPSMGGRCPLTWRRSSRYLEWHARRPMWCWATPSGSSRAW